MNLRLDDLEDMKEEGNVEPQKPPSRRPCMEAEVKIGQLIEKEGSGADVSTGKFNDIHPTSCW